MIHDFWDGRSRTRISAEPDGRVAIEGYDGELLVHRTTYSSTVAALIAIALTHAAKEAR
ncbi:hypothetical protein [Nocardia sp. MH4]|uniref:hypothetical protein n=1 Tax=Nocardia sp. MH4 TaxID=1768677 RepID=UPI001C4EFC86|nr:hypothetical protein [Nocardia sp. MH4]